MDFVMIRSGYGYYHEDSNFRTYASACEANGIPYGFYHYSYALNLEDAKLEVAGMLNSVKGFKPTYPLAIDMEDGDGWKAAHGSASNEMYTNICSLFCNTLEENGYYAMIYANLNWFRTILNSSVLDKYDKWLAQWTSKPTYEKEFGIWQYSSTGSVPGIQGNVDMDIAYKDYHTLIIEEGLNHYGDTSVPTPNPEPEPDTNFGTTYTVQTGDSLWGIAQKFYGNGNRYSEIASANDIANPDLIYAGEVLKIPGNTNTVTYTVKAGDNLSTIAARYGMNWKTLYEMNRSVIGSNPNLIHPGQILQIK